MCDARSSRVPLLVARAALAAALVTLAAGFPSAAPQRGADSSSAPPPAAAGQPEGGDPQGRGNPQGDNGGQQPTFRGGINFVRVDVIVTDKKAQPILDLKASDFEVIEDGKPQAVEQFQLIRIDGNPRPGEPAPRAIRTRDDEEMEAAKEDVRLFAIFFDDYHVRRTNSMSVREPLTRFVQTQLRPNDMVALMYPLTPVHDISFTRNQNAILSAIQSFEGRKFEYEPRNQFEFNYMRYPTETVERIRNDVVMTALQALATRLGSLREGRKSIIFVSEGFTTSLPPQMRRNDASGPQPLTATGSSETNSRETTAAWFSEADVHQRLREVYQIANRHNASIYALDPRGLAPFEYDINDGGINGAPTLDTDRRALQATQDTLRVVSEETDGRAIVNRNTLLEGLTQIVRDASTYYLLGYSSSHAPTDGKFHEIKVRVKRPNVDVRARKGYWAATVADTVRAANPTPDVVKPVQQALAAIAPSVQAGKYVRTWIGTERSENGKTRVTLVWEPLPTPPGSRRDPVGRVSVLAADAKGELVFRGRSPDAALASNTPARGASDTGLTGRGAPSATPAVGPQRIVFDAPPGKTELRLTVEAAGGGGTLDNEIRTIDVPDLTAPQLAMSTPRVWRARTARELQALASDATAVPVPSREFSRTERLLVRFEVYGPGGEQATVTAAILNRAGDKIFDVPVAQGGSASARQLEVGLSTVPPGEYLLEITLDGPSGPTKELMGLRVTS